MNNNNIIATFNSEKDLLNAFPKKFYWNLNDIFNDYWDNFLSFAHSRNLSIRPVVLDEVNKMRLCKTKALGYSLFDCPNCGKRLPVYNTCKGRFCNSCGVKYAKQRTNNILSKLVGCNHRHMVFTMPSILWPIFQNDRSLLSLVFSAVSSTLLSWFSDSYKSLKYKPGFILVLHTFGRDDKWNVHMHCLIAERALGINSERKVDFFPFEMLRKRFRTILLNLLDHHFKYDVSFYDKFRSIKSKCYSNYEDGFYVRAKKNEFSSSKDSIEYVLRYCGRPCFASYRIIDIEDNYISFWYQRHGDNLFVVEKIHIFEFIGRLIKHIPEKNFKTIRYYGFYSTKPNKLYETARKLIDKAKSAFYKTQTKWRNLMLMSFGKDPLKCSCGAIMKFKYRVPRLE